MNLLIIGSNGQLGWELCRQGRAAGYAVLPYDLLEMDITREDQVKQVLGKTCPDIVINAAAYTAVDQAEAEPEKAFAVNRDGPAFLADSCKEAGIPMIHISTDYVFDGLKTGPYLETDPFSPIGVYGTSKAEGEKEIRKRLPHHIILRTAWLYGVHGHNFVKTMLRLGREKEIISVVNDQHGCPTYAADLAQAVLSIADNIASKKLHAWGTYHYCGSGKATWHEFALKIFEIASRYESLTIQEVKPISTSEYPTPAVRPGNSVLDCSLLGKEFGIIAPDWRDGLSRMLSRYYHNDAKGRPTAGFNPSPVLGDRLDV